MEFKHPNLVCESFCTMTSGMNSLLIMYQRPPLHQGNFPHDIPKVQCHQVWIANRKSVSWRNLRLSLYLFFTHLASARVARAMAQAATNAAGNPAIRKGFRDQISFKTKGFFSPLYSPHIKIHYYKLTEKNMNNASMWTRKVLIFILSIWEMSHYIHVICSRVWKRRLAQVSFEGCRLKSHQEWPKLSGPEAGSGWCVQLWLVPRWHATGFQGRGKQLEGLMRSCRETVVLKNNQKIFWDCK